MSNENILDHKSHMDILDNFFVFFFRRYFNKQHARTKNTITYKLYKWSK